jgi:hypothetical protein
MRVAIVGVTAAALGAMGLLCEPASAAPERAGAAVAAVTDFSAQARVRPRTRIRVTPRCFYRSFSTTYPVPYECEFPGPGAVRQCTSWLATEHRPSGTVIVPHMRCWWER